MAVRRRKIRELVQRLVTEAGITEAPVPVWEIARAKGARIVPDSLEGDLSGFLYRDALQKVIGVNTQHAAVRQNFTVAHELAHLLLHDQEQLHVDRAFPTVRLRERRFEPGRRRCGERGQSLFAAELLMPETVPAARSRRTERPLGALCYIVPGTSFGERNGQHERTAWEWRNPRFSGCCAVCFAVHFGIQTGSIG
jgi:Zn-dependent peptidase ImmA (M78 family)